MIITVHNKQKDLPLSSPQAKKILLLLLKELRISTHEVIVHFVSKTKIAEVHGVFFADPTPTDCMSFPIDPPMEEASLPEHHILGEIFVCPKVAMEYAEKKQLDPYTETALYMIHGFLHLIGYDDLEPKARKKMRSMEKKCLALTHSFSLQSHKKKIVLKSPITV
ncbi:MAG: rRNA maturation RNase YbeY [Chlamydiota bacterium]